MLSWTRWLYSPCQLSPPLKSNRLDPSDHRARVTTSDLGLTALPKLQNPSQIPIAPILQRLLTYGSSRSKAVNWFGKLKNPSTTTTTTTTTRWQQKDTPLRTSHLLKKTPCSLTYCTSLPYLVIGSLQALSEVFYTVFYWQAGYAILAAAAPWIFHSIQSLLSSLLCSCGVILLIVTGIFQQYLVYQVQKIRLQGYYVFSQKLKHIVRLPFAATAYGTAAMLLVMVWKPHISILSISVLLRQDENVSISSDIAAFMASQIEFKLRIIMLIEVVCAGFFMSAYIGYIYQYNSLDSQPDVLKSLYSPLQPSSSLEGLR
ncbi:hypothetical protein RHMOL_Rhmol03G0251200 [Rhododendron molle]|uniref:Uncharacterized protein n=1 Tax=Rhododendron molle TaxID=49168 RepID=A0ACC0PHZ9_RHOML|nr:hypothetical protein RHMOL_Rhmol03G0251200 [Rhododendron molle]